MWTELAVCALSGQLTAPGRKPRSGSKNRPQFFARKERTGVLVAAQIGSAPRCSCSRTFLHQQCAGIVLDPPLCDDPVKHAGDPLQALDLLLDRDWRPALALYG